MLYVMNEVILKNSNPGVGDEYLQAFSRFHPDIIENLIAYKSEELIELFRQLINIWEGNSLYIKDYTQRLKSHVQEAQNAVINERSGASVIQKFDITAKLEALEQIRKSNAVLSEKADNVY